MNAKWPITPIERRENTVRREPLAMPEQSGFFGGRSNYPGGGDFFSRLFGRISGTGAATPQPRSQRKRSAQQPRTEIR